MGRSFLVWASLSFGVTLGIGGGFLLVFPHSSHTDSFQVLQASGYEQMSQKSPPKEQSLSDLRKAKEPDEDRRSILLMGDDGGDLTDTLMVAQIDNTTDEIYMVSIPRDLIVFDEFGGYAKINSIFSRSLQREEKERRAMIVLSKYITRITGIEIDHYLKINFTGFTEVIDHVGGVTVDVKRSINDPYFPDKNNGYDPFQIDEGTQTLDGETALKYARSRKTSPNGDFDRAARQQQIVESFSRDILERDLLKNPQELMALLRIALRNSVSDFSLRGLYSLYQTYQHIDDYQVKQIVLGEDLAQGPLKQGYRMFGRSRGYVLEPKIGPENYLEIKEIVRHLGRRQEYQNRLQGMKKEDISVGIVGHAEHDRAQDLVDLWDHHSLDNHIIDTHEQQFSDMRIYVSDPELQERAPNTISYLMQSFSPEIIDGNPDYLQDEHLEEEYDVLIYLREEQ